MSQHFEHPPQQYEGQEHQFLTYEDVYVHFIYSFSWDLEKKSWADWNDDLLYRHKSREKQGKPGNGWQKRLLHERSLRLFEKDVRPTYQPSLVTKAAVLQRTQTIMDGLTVLVPIEQYDGVQLKGCRELPINLSYTIRLFQNGTATCTFVVHLLKQHANFENIHFVLRLAHNVDLGYEPERHHVCLTNSFLNLPDGPNRRGDNSLFPTDKTESATYEEGYCSLHDLFRRLLRHSHNWLPKGALDLWNEKDTIELNDIHQDFETPFIFTVAQVERNSFLRFRKSSTPNASKEIGSIMCKLTLDNRQVLTDFLHLSEDYLTTVLPYNKTRGGLLNLCLDRRLFFGLSRRGAIAVTANLGDIPARFVVPSFLNLCEILRARWHLGNITNIELDKAINTVTHANGMSPTDILQMVYRWRASFGLFLRDPVPFLFDGGSITEIAELADREFWLTKMRDDAHRKFEMIDRLVRDLLERKRIEEFMKWRSESGESRV